MTIGEDRVHITEKGEIEILPCGTPYFNIPASEKNIINIISCLRDRT